MATRLSIRELRAALDAAGIDSTGCTERRELEHLHKIAATLPRLLIFGDSWARADPIPTWCPSLVTDALSIVALVLAAAAAGSAVLGVVFHAKKAVLPTATMAQPLIVGK